MAEESNFNMINGLMNNRRSGKKNQDVKHRPSVLAKLRQKQREIAAKSGKQQEQVQESDVARCRK